MDADPDLPPAETAGRTAAMFALGFASGLPYQLLRDVPRAWLTQQHATAEQIGALGVLAFPAAVKFLWAPLLDRYVPPLLGRRRGWIVVFQFALVIAVLAMGRSAGSFSALRAIGVVVAFCSASQDIVIDAYRTDVLPPAERGPGTSYFVVSYKLATIAVGGGLLGLVGSTGLPWSGAYALSAGAMALCVLATFAVPVEPWADRRPKNLRQSIVLPVIDLLARRRIGVVLLFVFLFKIPEVLAGMFTVKFLLDAGFSTGSIGFWRGGVGIGMTIAGTLAGGAITGRLGTRQALWAMGTAGAVSNIGLAILAKTGPVTGLMPVVVCCESFCAGLVTASFVAFLMGQCSRLFSATHYAVLSGIPALSEWALGSPAGRLCDHFGYTVFFAISVAAGIPSLLLIAWLPKVEPSPAVGGSPIRDR